MLFPTTIKVGRRGIPRFFMLDLSFPPHQFLSRMIRYSKWSMVPTEQNVIVRMEDTELQLTPSAWTTIFAEWSNWKRHYLEFLPKDARTVLDVGAGCGETALLYLLHGVQKVICLEPNPERFRFLENNRLHNKWNVSSFQERFGLSSLKRFDFDFMKMDCEGCERDLLSADSLPPCVIEVHQDRVRVEDLRKRFPGLRLAKRQSVSRLWIVGTSSPLEAAHAR